MHAHDRIFIGIHTLTYGQQQHAVEVADLVEWAAKLISIDPGMFNYLDQINVDMWTTVGWVQAGCNTFGCITNNWVESGEIMNIQFGKFKLPNNKTCMLIHTMLFCSHVSISHHSPTRATTYSAGSHRVLCMSPRKVVTVNVQPSSFYKHVTCLENTHAVLLGDW
jgi:hypothetical protein